jgi:hypothetical protein
MALKTIEKYFQVTADNTDVLSGDAQLGNLGPGFYDVIAVAAAAADGTLTLADEIQTILSAMPIPVRAGAVTFPEIKFNEDRPLTIAYNGPTHPTINVADGTNAECVVWVRYRRA